MYDKHFQNTNVHLIVQVLMCIPKTVTSEILPHKIFVSNTKKI